MARVGRAVRCRRARADRGVPGAVPRADGAAHGAAHRPLRSRRSRRRLSLARVRRLRAPRRGGVQPRADGSAASTAMTGAWRARVCPAVLALVPAAALALHGASEDDAILAALKVVVATFAVAVVPGALVFLLWAPR